MQRERSAEPADDKSREELNVETGEGGYANADSDDLGDDRLFEEAIIVNDGGCE